MSEGPQRLVRQSYIEIEMEKRGEAVQDNSRAKFTLDRRVEMSEIDADWDDEEIRRRMKQRQREYSLRGLM